MLHLFLEVARLNIHLLFCRQKNSAAWPRSWPGSCFPWSEASLYRPIISLFGRGSRNRTWSARYLGPLASGLWICQQNKNVTILSTQFWIVSTLTSFCWLNVCLCCCMSWSSRMRKTNYFCRCRINSLSAVVSLFLVIVKKGKTLVYMFLTRRAFKQELWRTESRTESRPGSSIQRWLHHLGCINTVFIWSHSKELEKTCWICSFIFVWDKHSVCIVIYTKPFSWLQ